jgi:hypothetical protein
MIGGIQIVIIAFYVSVSLGSTPDLFINEQSPEIESEIPLLTDVPAIGNFGD